jgi:imidazolonepropionase-like amidohydrolase
MNYELRITNYETIRVNLRSSAVKLSLHLCAFALIFLLSFSTMQAQIAVKGETVWTMAGEQPITNGVVLINNGKIEAVGAAAQIVIPSNYRVINAKVVTPGLIDARTVIGLAGYMNQPHDQMALESSSPMQPELRAIDSYNPQEKLVGWVREFGVTTIHTGHAPGALVSGQTMIAKTVGNTADAAAITPTAMIAVTIGDSANAGGGRAPGTRAKQAAMLRAELIKASEAVRKQDADKKSDQKPPVELRGEMMQRVIRREIPLLVTAHRAQDIMTTLRIAKEFNVRIVLDGAAEAFMVIDEIKASGFPVIIHPTMYRAGGEMENLSMTTATKLKAAGVTVALQSGYENYVPKTRVVLFEAGIAAANGLSMRDALATVTIDAAKILGLDSRIGSLVKGKDADLAMYDGDPFEYTTHCTGTIINGQIVSETIR